MTLSWIYTVVYFFTKISGNQPPNLTLSLAAPTERLSTVSSPFMVNKQQIVSEKIRIRCLMAWVCFLFLLFNNNFPASFSRIFLLMKVWILPTTMLVQWFAWEYPFLTSEVPKSISRWNIMTWNTTKKRQSWQGRNGTKFKLFGLWTRYDYSYCLFTVHSPR